MNDWEIKKFLKVILAIQFALLGSIGLETIGLQIPILRQFIGFIYLSFVPGILILRILKLHKLGNIETLLYTVGLSLAILMFTGFFMNMFYPFLGISGPISLVPLIVTISVVVLVLCILCYVRDKDFSDPSFIDVGGVLSPPVLFLCLIPFLSILGTYLVNIHHTNILLMLMIVVIALVVLLISFDKFIPKNLYPLAIWVMSISLIWHTALISNYVFAKDVYGEFYVANLIINNFRWDTFSGYLGNYNSVLSVTIIPPIFYNICNSDLTWIYKIIFPLFLSLTPLGLYLIFKKYTNGKISFLAVFLFIALFYFYTTVPFLTKQLFAEFFFILLLIILLDKNLDKTKRSILSIIFAMSLIVSHYGTSYLVMFSLIFVLFFLFFTENQTIKRILEKNYFTYRKKEWIKDNLNIKNKAISPNFVLLFIIFTLTWYIYISNSLAFNALVNIGDHIANTIFTDFLSPKSSRGAYMMTKEMPSPLYNIYKIIHLVVQFFIVIGILKELLQLQRRETKFEGEYLVFSVYWLMICIAAIAVSGFAVMNPNRLYHLSLIILAPFSVIGGITIFEMITKIFFKIAGMNKSMKHSLNVLSVFLVIFLLFNTSFIFEIANDHPYSVSVSQESIKKGDIKDKGEFLYFKLISIYDVYSSKWLSKNMDQDKKIYATVGHGEGRGVLMAYGNIPKSKIRHMNNKTISVTDSYIYLYYSNVVEKIRADYIPKLGCPTYHNMTDIYPLLKDKNKIYTNGGSEVLWS